MKQEGGLRKYGAVIALSPFAGRNITTGLTRSATYRSTPD